MVEFAFTVTYDGPTRATDRLPIRHLSPALLALGELFADASTLVDPDREPAVLELDTTVGGPGVSLVLCIAEQDRRVTDLLATDPAATLDAIRAVVLGAENVVGLLDLIAHTDDGPITNRQPIDEHLVSVTLHDGTVLTTRTETLQLHADRTARRNARTVARPLQLPGVESLQVASPTTPTRVLVGAADADAFESRADVETVVSETELLLEVAAPAFPANNKWRLTGTTGSFWATIGDGAFLNRINAGEPFRKGDALRCRFKLTQTKGPSGLQLEHHVVQVLQHVARGQQLRLDDAA